MKAELTPAEPTPAEIFRKVVGRKPNEEDVEGVIKTIATTEWEPSTEEIFNQSVLDETKDVELMKQAMRKYVENRMENENRQKEKGKIIVVLLFFSCIAVLIMLHHYNVINLNPKGCKAGKPDALGKSSNGYGRGREACQTRGETA